MAVQLRKGSHQAEHQVSRKSERQTEDNLAECGDLVGALDPKKHGSEY